MIRVVLVEDQINLRSEIVSSLRAEGFEVIGVGSGTELFFELMQKPADIIIMDIGLPGESGMGILQQLRSLTALRALGIIMLTGRFDLSCRVECLTNGADAFLTKPVEIEELTAYINNLYRRMHSDTASFDALKWQFHHRDWRLLCPSGAVVELSHLESEFLKILVEHAGNAVRRRDIISIAFKKDPLTYDNRSLEAIVSRLRRKIHALYPHSHPIKAVHSIGYVFTDSVKAF
jgi:DNA-binding response OmpR family regulator